MKSALVIALAASLVAAQSLDGIPECAKGCVSKYISGTSVAGCKVADIACVCKNKDFLNSIACCLVGVCGQAEQDNTVKFATQLCTASGVQVPDKVVCNNGASPSGSTSGSASGTAAPKTTGTTASGSVSGTATGASTTSTSTAAAVPVVGGVGGLAGAVLAMLAVL